MSAGVASRRAPWPYSLKINGVGVRVKGDIVGRKVQSLAGVVPTSAEYGTEDLYRERSHEFRRPVLGMGERTQSAAARSRRYRYALNCWFSGGLRGKGPLWHNLAPSSTGEVRDFPEALHGGALTQFILAGRYVLRRTSDLSAGQVVSQDLGASRQAQSAVRFKHPSGTDCLYVAVDNDDFWQYNGATWTQLDTAIDANYLAVVRDELWRAYDNQISKCTADPATAANWSAPIAVGDASSNITGLAVANDALIVFKDDGSASTVTVNEDASLSVNDLMAGLRTTRAGTNGRNPASWLNSVWFRSGPSFWRLTPAGEVAELQQVGPERLLENDSEVGGVATCFAGYAAWYGLMGVYNAQNTSSYLLQYGDWLPPDAGDESRYDFADVLNGALLKWESRQITALRVSTLVAGNPRCYAGFSDGTFGWFLLPAGSPSPFAADSGCEFADGSLGPSRVYWPTNTLMAPADYKAYLSLAAYGPVLDSNNRVEAAYRLNPGLAYAPLSADLNAAGARVDFPDGTVGKLLDYEETLASPDSSSTPVVESVVLRQALRPSTRLEYGFTVDARDHAPLRDGRADRKTAAQIREIVKAFADDPAAGTLELPDETSQSFAAITYQETIPDDARRRGLAYDLAVSAIQFRTNEVYGTFARLGAMTFAELGDLTFAELGVL